MQPTSSKFQQAYEPDQRTYDRIILIVMDSVGCGAAKDAKKYGDQDSNTLTNLSRAVGGLSLPHFAELGLMKITPILGTETPPSILGAYGRMQEASAGKDTTTGHFEIAGLITEKPLPVFPNGFPQAMLEVFSKQTGRGVLCNQPASGTQVIEDFGAQHLRTGKLIVYTSADSVFQIAAHEEVVPIEELYRIGQMARTLCDEYGIGRVIVRPFIGQPGSFQRTYNRRDFSLVPKEPTVLDAVHQAGLPVVGIGKIWDIFSGRGVSENIHSEGNLDGMKQTLEAMKQVKEGLIFCNLVDFDMLYGHRRDVAGYAKALVEMDAWLPQLRQAVTERDLVMITADHGNDPTFPGSDHTREDVPILAFSKHPPKQPDLGTRQGFYDVAQTICDALNLPVWPRGRSFLPAREPR